MPPDRWKRIRGVFSIVVDLPAGERGAVLRQQCDGDGELREAVERLLEKNDRSAALLDGGSPIGLAAEPDRRDPLLAPGEVVFERFRILRMLGRGGMGEVYECEDIELGQPVALKALRPQAPGGTDPAARFKREIQLARRVTHPNVCRVFDIGRHTTGHSHVNFFTMELVAGRTLAERMQREGPLSPDRALPLIEQIAAGLSALHARNIVHRDLKPGNILLEESAPDAPRVVLTDFGIAGTIGGQKDAASFATVTGQIMGTPDYMAPEQLTGKAAGPATDLFALGIVMYEMLTGRKPFPDDSRRTATPVAPSRHNSAIPAEWDRVILDCLRTGIAERPQSAQAVLDGLRGAPSRPDPADEPTASEQPRPARRRFLSAGVLCFVFLSLIAAGYRVLKQEPTIGPSKRIAVLPFQVAQGESELQAVAGGLMDTITSRLSQYEGLNEQLLVVPASEVRKLKVARADDARGVLGVNYAVEGRLATQDDRVRLNLTLIDAEKMLQQDSAVINGSLAKALDLEDNAVRRLATLLDLHAQPDQLESIASVAPGADEFYLEAKGYLHRSDELESIDNAIQLFQKAIALDPRHARAQAGLGQAYLFKYDRTGAPEWIANADEASQRAVDLDDQSLEARVARGRVLLSQGRQDESLASFRIALNLNPRSADAYAGLAQAYERGADLAEDENERTVERANAETAYRKSLSLRPNDWVAYKRLGLFYYRTGRHEEAIEQFDSVAELAPNNAQAYVNLGVFHYLASDPKQAEIYWKKALEIDPGRLSALTNLAKALYGEGRYEEAVQAYERIVGLNTASHKSWANLGDSYEKLGRRREARESYRRAIGLIESKIAVEGESQNLHASLAHHWAHLGELTQSKVHALQAIHSESAEDQIAVGIAFRRIGDHKSAVHAVGRALALGYPRASIARIDSLAPLLDEFSDTQGETTQ